MIKSSDNLHENEVGKLSGKEGTLKEISDRLGKDWEENFFIIVDPYDDLEECANLLDKENSESFSNARKAYSTALHTRKDTLLRAKAFRAFAACYSDMGLENKAAEMRKKMQELVREGLEP